MIANVAIEKSRSKWGNQNETVSLAQKKWFDIITVKWESKKIIVSHFPILNFDTFPQNNCILTKTLLYREDHSTDLFFSICSTKKPSIRMLHEANLCHLLPHLCTSPGTAASLEILACFLSTISSLLICFKTNKILIQSKSSAYPRIMTYLVFSNLKIQLWQLKLKQVIIFYSWIHVRSLSEKLVLHSVTLNTSMLFLLSCEKDALFSASFLQWVAIRTPMTRFPLLDYPHQ